MALASIADLNGPPEEIALRIGHAKLLSTMYDDFLTMEQEETPDDGSRPPGIHASELYPCLLKSYYSLTNMEKRKRISKFWLQRFKVGHAIHEMLQADFARMARRSHKGALLQAEKTARAMNCVLEFEDEVQVDPKYQPLAAYYHLYMAALDLPVMWFFYMNKGNQNNTNSEAPWLTVWQPAVWAEMQDRMLILHEMARTKQVPAKTEGIWCEFCPWSWHCQPDAMSKAPPVKPTTRRELVRGPGGK